MVGWRGNINPLTSTLVGRSAGKAIIWVLFTPAEVVFDQGGQTGFRQGYDLGFEASDDGIDP